MDTGELIAAAEAYRAALRVWYAAFDCDVEGPERERVLNAVEERKAEMLHVCYRDLITPDPA